MNMSPRRLEYAEIAEAAGRSYPVMENVAARYWEDKLFRSRIDSGNDIDDVLVELDVDLPPGVAARLVANTSDTYHVVFPPDPNVDLSDESLSMVAGGKSAGTVGSAGSASTLGSVCGTAGTFATASSAGSASSAG